MGDPNTPEGRAQLERQSPLNSASKITAPLLVIQGGSDPRVKKAESEQIVVALRDRGFPVEYIMAPDEGHGFARPVNNMAAFAAAERFLARQLGGRFQDGGTPEVLARLGEIAVDPATVTVSIPVDLSSVGAPTPVRELQAGTFQYSARLEIAGQTVPLTTSITATEDGDTWVITQSVATPAGAQTDRTVIAKDGLGMRSRSIVQGQVSIDLAVAGGTIGGRMSAGAQGADISAPVEGALFADGAAAPLALGTLPLADGYTTAFSNFAVQPPKVRTVLLTVVGSETVTVPAGTFDAFKVELTSPDDEGRTTYWVAKDSHRAVKSVVTGPQLNGGTMTIELAK